MIPDYPNNRNPRAFWFSCNDQELAISRLIKHKRAEAKKITWAAVKRMFSSWVVYFMTVLYDGIVLATYGYVYFSLFLKAQKKADGSRRW